MATKKYRQKNPMVGVRFTPEVYDLILKEAERRRWSMANLVAYCVEQYFELEGSTIKRRR